LELLAAFKVVLVGAEFTLVRDFISVDRKVVLFEFIELVKVVSVVAVSVGSPSPVSINSSVAANSSTVMSSITTGSSVTTVTSAVDSVVRSVVAASSVVAMSIELIELFFRDRFLLRSFRESRLAHKFFIRHTLEISIKIEELLDAYLGELLLFVLLVEAFLIGLSVDISVLRDFDLFNFWRLKHLLKIVRVTEPALFEVMTMS
jgi:hypothetical protein